MLNTDILNEYVRAFLVSMVCSTFLLSNEYGIGILVCTSILAKYGEKGYSY